MRKHWNSSIAICCNCHPMLNGFTKTPTMPRDQTVADISMCALSDISKILYYEWYQSHDIFARNGWGLSNIEFYERVHWNLRDTWNLIGKANNSLFKATLFTQQTRASAQKCKIAMNWVLQMFPTPYDIIYNINFKLIKDIPQLSLTRGPNVFGVSCVWVFNWLRPSDAYMRR